MRAVRDPLGIRAVVPVLAKTKSQELVFDADMRPYMLYVMKSASHCGKVELTRQNINHDSLRLPRCDANSQLRCSPSLVILEHRWKDSDKSRC